MERSRRSMDVISPKPPPQCSNSQGERESQSQSQCLRSKGFKPHIRHSNLLTPALVGQHPKCLDLKTTGADVQETKRAMRNWDSSLKGLSAHLLAMGPSAKAIGWKIPYVCERHSLAHHKASARGTRVCRNSLQNRRSGGHHFPFFLCF